MRHAEAAERCDTPFAAPALGRPVRRALLPLLAALCLGCVAHPAAVIDGAPAAADAPQVSFASYRHAALAEMEGRRAFQGADRAAELAWNAPTEWRPEGPPRAGVLLVHGLGDSPWTFHDIGTVLAGNGYLVRTVLLPGHGTRPEDILEVTLEDWRQVVEVQADVLRGEVEQVFLGGFSTGANLVLEHAYRTADVAGLLLFSPAFRSDSTYDWLAPWIGWARPWLREPDGVRPMQNAVRYMMVPTNGFAQFYRSSRQARGVLRRAPFDRPVFMVVAEHDSVLDTAYLAATFSTRFTHPASRLVWYGAAPASASDDLRILVRPDRLPEWRISQFSHMGVMFSPANPLYGSSGSLRICWNGQDAHDTAACGQGASVWWSDWGYREDGKIHARLTFNPRFDWQAGVMLQVLESMPAASAGDDG